MRYFVVGILLTTITLLLTAAFFQRHALACELLPVLNYQQIDGDVYTGADISENKVDTLKKLVDSASERIGNVYGKPTSKPRILITSNSQMAEKWGANENASMHRMPWRSCIVIGPEGQNIDVIAHEWLHAEIQQRVGYFRFIMEIPVWFDEGAALTLDYRDPFLPENISLAATEIQDVKILNTSRAFFSDDIRKNYQAARLAVEPMIIEENFFYNLERLSLGESLESVFYKIDKSVQPFGEAPTE